jgi:hypothetical protein
MYSRFRNSLLEAFDGCAFKSAFQHQQIEHPLKGPEGESLFTDIFYTEPQGQKTFVHQSGIHGVEGYLGSLIQRSLFQKTLDQIKSLPFQLVIIHAVNPYGMAWYRRTNSNNVDLNRNSHDGTIHNPEFKNFLPILNSPTKLSAILEIARLLPKIASLGPTGMVTAVATGQLTNKESVFYGGLEYQPELQNLFATLLKIIPNENEVAAIDVHTGLGKLGDESLLLDGPDVNRESEFFTRVFEKKCGPVSGVSYDAQGCVAFSYKKHWLTNFVTQEFGTKPFYNVLWNLLHGNKEQLQETFYPDNQWWRDTCVDAGVLRFQQILKSY